MPKLLIFAACERVVIDSEDGNVSMFSIIEGFKLDASGDLPADAVIPIKWAVLSMWRKQTEDEGKEYEQKVQLISPSGAILAEGTSKFRLIKSSHRLRLNIQVLPAGEAGDWLLQLSLRDTSTEEWAVVGEYPFTITRQQIPTE